MNSAQLADVIKTIFMLRLKSYDLEAHASGYMIADSLPLQLSSLPVEDNPNIVAELRQIERKLLQRRGQAITEPETPKHPAGTSIPIVHRLNMEFGLTGIQIEKNAEKLLAEQLKLADGIAEKIAAQIIKDYETQYPQTHFATDVMKELSNSTKFTKGRKLLDSFIRLVDKQMTHIDRLESIFTILLKNHAPNAEIERTPTEDGKGLTLKLVNWPEGADWQSTVNFIEMYEQMAKSPNGIKKELGIGHPPILTITLDSKDPAAQEFAKRQQRIAQRSAIRANFIPHHMQPAHKAHKIKDDFPSIDMETRVLQKMTEQLIKSALEHAQVVVDKAEPDKKAKAEKDLKRVAKATEKLTELIGKSIKDPKLQR